MAKGYTNILSRASEVGSPTNPPWAPDSDKTQGQGCFSPFTGGLPIKNFKKKRNVHLTRFLLRQGEPGTSHMTIIIIIIIQNLLSAVANNTFTARMIVSSVTSVLFSIVCTNLKFSS